MGPKYRAALAIVLLASQVSFAQDAPRMYQPDKPELVGYPNWVLTSDGADRITATLARQHNELVSLRTENSSLRTSLVEMESKPALTLKGGVVLILVGISIGLVVGIPVALAVAR